MKRLVFIYTFILEYVYYALNFIFCSVGAMALRTFARLFYVRPTRLLAPAYIVGHHEFLRQNVA